MASLHAPPEPHIQISPAALRDDDGGYILPADRLPGVDFGAHLHPNRNGSSYFTSHRDGAEGTGTDAPSTSVDAGGDGVGPPDVSRSLTAPAVDVRRPRPATDRRSFLDSFRRQNTNSGFNDNARNPYQYTFDPMSSDSDSDSSSEEGSTAPRRPVHRRMKTSGGADLGSKPRRDAARRGQSYSKFNVGNEHYRSSGKVSKKDGRLNISINETEHSGYIAKALGRGIRHHLDIPDGTHARKQRRYASDHPAPKTDQEEDDESAASIEEPGHPGIPRLNIVIIVIGSRGDIQPFLRIGQILKHEYGHRVRFATHPPFRDFIEKENGIEFFSIGGDPSELMAFMVKNPGLIPSMKTIRDGEIQRRRAAMGDMFEGMWRACIGATDDEHDPQHARMLGNNRPFVADAIIANPPSMAHVHIAEKLGVPLHIMFTMPYTPTQQFPHPLASIRAGKSNVDANYVNFMSYPLVEMMTWQGLGDIVNRFRERTLKLEPVSQLWAPGALYRMKVPYTYIWSPALVPKPADWGPEIDVSGYVFLELASGFKPPQDLVDFLAAGEPPVYIGFGSIVVDDPNAFTEMIFEAVKIAGVRALVNKGWGGLGQSNSSTPENVYMLGNTPHDWLFPKVRAVVHHGGAGTTAIGLKLAKPTMIVPFFGDQSFWAARVVEAGAGARECIPWKKLTAERLAEGIKQCLTEEAQKNVQIMADAIANEGDGAANAVKSFHRSLPLAGRNSMRCSILHDRVAVWKVKGKGSWLRLSTLAAEILLQKGKINRHDLSLYRASVYGDFDGPGEPVTGTVGALADSFTEMGAGMGMVPIRIAKHLKKRQEHEQKKQRHAQRKEERRQRRLAQASGPHTATTHTDDATPSEARPTTQREPTTTTMGSALSADPSEPLAREIAGDVGDGVKRTGAALLTMPNDLHVAIAQGFHNAPRLWGDATVRQPVRITGFKSGCHAAGHEFVYGVRDGWAGVVTQPVGGFKDGDTIASKLCGLGSGVGKGIGGFVLKNISALVSPPAYIGKGAILYYKKKAEGPGAKALIRAERFDQGRRDLTQLREASLADRGGLQRLQARVDEGWQIHQDVRAYALEQYGPVRRNVVARFKLRRARDQWVAAGVLETVDTAREALAAHRAGEPLDDHLERRRSATRRAEQPKESTLVQKPAATVSSGAELHDGRTRSDAETTAEPLSDGGVSDQTVVADTEDEEVDPKPPVGGQVMIDAGGDVMKKAHGGPLMKSPAMGRLVTA